MKAKEKKVTHISMQRCILVIVMVLLCIVVITIAINHTNRSKEIENKDLKSIGTEEYFTPNLSLPEDLTLYIHPEEDFYVGEETTLEFVLPTEETSAIIINADTNEIICKMDQTRSNENEEQELYGNYTFTPQREELIRIKAYTDSHASSNAYLSIKKKMNSEEQETSNTEYMNVTADLSDFVNVLSEEYRARGEESTNNKKFVDEVENWLKENEHIKKVKRDGKYKIEYTTQGGATGFVDLSYKEEGPFDNIIRKSDM